MGVNIELPCNGGIVKPTKEHMMVTKVIVELLRLFSFLPLDLLLQKVEITLGKKW
jgi:hypothetical protein